MQTKRQSVCLILFICSMFLNIMMRAVCCSLLGAELLLGAALSICPVGASAPSRESLVVRAWESMCVCVCVCACLSVC